MSELISVEHNNPILGDRLKQTSNPFHTITQLITECHCNQWTDSIGALTRADKSDTICVKVNKKILRIESQTQLFNCVRF